MPLQVVSRFFCSWSALRVSPLFSADAQPLEALFRDGGILTFQRIRDRSLTGFYRIENFFPAREHILLKQGFFVLVLEAGKNPGDFLLIFCRTEGYGVDLLDVLVVERGPQSVLLELHLGPFNFRLIAGKQAEFRFFRLFFHVPPNPDDLHRPTRVGLVFFQFVLKCLGDPAKTQGSIAPLHGVRQGIGDKDLNRDLIQVLDNGDGSGVEGMNPLVRQVESAEIPRGKKGVYQDQNRHGSQQGHPALELV